MLEAKDYSNTSFLAIKVSSEKALEYQLTCESFHKTTFLKFDSFACAFQGAIFDILLGECMALWDKPNELSIQHLVYIFMQYVDS